MFYPALATESLNVLSQYEEIKGLKDKYKKYLALYMPPEAKDADLSEEYIPEDKRPDGYYHWSAWILDLIKEKFREYAVAIELIFGDEFDPRYNEIEILDELLKIKTKYSFDVLKYTVDEWKHASDILKPHISLIKNQSYVLSKNMLLYEFNYPTLKRRIEWHTPAIPKESMTPLITAVIDLFIMMKEVAAQQKAYLENYKYEGSEIEKILTALEECNGRGRLTFTYVFPDEKELKEKLEEELKPIRVVMEEFENVH